MRLRTFTASSMKEAIATVRAELGPDAIIISAHERPRGRGVEVRAAVEQAVLPPKPERGGLAQAAKAQARRAAAPEPTRETTPAPEPPRGLAQLAKRRIGTRASENAAGASREEILKSALAFHGLGIKRIANLMSAVRRTDLNDPAQALASAFDSRYAFNPLAERPRRPVMLVGDPGAGKTVTTAKLAARALLAGHKVEVVTTDTLRSGAVEQLTKLLAAMKLTPVTVETPNALLRHLVRLKDRERTAVFIDSPGTNALSTSERDDLARFLAVDDVEPVLVMAAGQDPEEAADHARVYGALGVRRAIVTRLDAARRFGALLVAAEEGPLAIAQVSLSPYLSEPLSALTPGAVARVLLAQANALRSGETSALAEHFDERDVR